MVQSYHVVTKNLPIQVVIQAPTEVKHPITEDIKEDEEVGHQDEPCVVDKSFISSDHILHDP